eukprot:365084-Chlamydomonas_euryale.AAC.14
MHAVLVHVLVWPSSTACTISTVCPSTLYAQSALCAHPHCHRVPIPASPQSGYHHGLAASTELRGQALQKGTVSHPCMRGEHTGHKQQPG